MERLQGAQEDRKRPAVQQAEQENEGLLVVTSRNGSSQDVAEHKAITVTPEKLQPNKRPKLDDERAEKGGNEDKTECNDSATNQEQHPEEAPLIDESDDHKDKDKKKTANKSPRIVAAAAGPAPIITGDTVMGFPKYPRLTNRKILIEHIDYVMWARRQAHPSFKLKQFLDWTSSEEGRLLEQGGCCEFDFGQHRGQTFLQIAQTDPEYHIRYQAVLAKKRQAVKGTLLEYITWFDRSRQDNLLGGSRTIRTPRRTRRSTTTTSGANARVHFH